MRLTLRTMLAYLDDVLDPADAKDLAQKIEESELASNLIHRIRNSIGRLRLSSPDLVGSKLGEDPNTVAEYLDSTLDIKDVPDFEKVCLDSDVHLAEVAACHQVLTLVLGEPARVDAGVRDRIYRLANASDQSAASQLKGFESQIDSPVASSTTASAAGSSESTKNREPDGEGRMIRIDRPRRRKPEVPDYLRAGAARRRPLWPIVALALLIGFLLTSGLLLAMGPLNKSHPLAGFFGIENGHRNLADSTAGEDTASALHNEFHPKVEQPASTVQPPTLIDRIDASSAPPSEPVDVPQVSPAPVSQPVPVSPEDTSAVLLPGVHELVDPALDADTFPTPPEPVDQPVLPDAGDFPIKPPASRTQSEPVIPSLEFDENSEALPPKPSVNPSLDAVATNDTPAEPDLADLLSGQNRPSPPKFEQEVAAELPHEVGGYTSPQQLVAYWDNGSDGWWNLPAKARLTVGIRLRALPGFSPTLELMSNVQVTLKGTGEVRVGTPVDADTPLLVVPNGRFLLTSAGAEAGRVALQLSDRDLLFELDAADTQVAVVTRSVMLPGATPGEMSPHSVREMFVTRGRVVVTPLQGEEVHKTVLEPGSVYSLVDDRSGVAGEVATLPDWITSTGVRAIDRKAADDLRELVQDQRSLTLVLSEIADNHRRADIRALATRALANMDSFDASIAALADVQQHPHWPDHFDELRAAIQRGPEVAALVKESFEKSHGSEAPRLFRMLLGYTDEQLHAGAGAELVDALDDNLVGRVLAYENLHRITGMTLLYRPEKSRTLNRKQVARWRAHLQEGPIVHAQPQHDVLNLRELEAD